MNRNTALWVLAAACGLVLAAGISWATSQLTSQHIGLSSEPISAGRRLAPTVAPAPVKTRTTAKPAPGRTSTTGTPATTLTETVQTTEQGPPSNSVGSTESGGSGDDGGASGSSRPGAGRDD